MFNETQADLARHLGEKAARIVTAAIKVVQELGTQNGWLPLESWRERPDVPGEPLQIHITTADFHPNAKVHEVSIYRGAQHVFWAERRHQGEISVIISLAGDWERRLLGIAAEAGAPATGPAR